MWVTVLKVKINYHWEAACWPWNVRKPKEVRSRILSCFLQQIQIGWILKIGRHRDVSILTFTVQNQTLSPWHHHHIVVTSFISHKLCSLLNLTFLQVNVRTSATYRSAVAPSSSCPTYSNTSETTSPRLSGWRTDRSTATSVERDSPQRAVWGPTRARWAERWWWWWGWGDGASQNCPKCCVVPSLKFNLNDNQTFVCFHVCFICCWTWKIWPEQRIPIIDKTFRVSAKTGPSLQTNLYTGIT